MSSSQPDPIRHSMLVLSIFYGGMICIAGVLGSKLAALGPLGVEAGIFAFLPLVAASSAIAETSGSAAANRLVLYGFIPLIASVILIRLVLALPPAPFWEAEKQQAFALTLGQSSRMMIAGMIAYGTSQLLNVFVFTRLKNGKSFLWFRALVAGTLSQVVDSLLFITIAFYGVAPIMLILPGQILAKVVLSVVLMPPLVYLLVAACRWLDREKS